MKYIPGKHYELSSGEHYDENAPANATADCIYCGQKRKGTYRGSNDAAHTYFCEEGFEYDEETEKIIKYHSFGVETEENKKKKNQALNKERLKGAAGGALAGLGVGAGAAKILSDAASEEIANEVAKVATEEAGKSFLSILKEEAIAAISNPIEWLFGDGFS
ncbi:MAG: hypothetical protein KDD63_10790 [Bacteroidetes bacterium]|nr:hypothetical protein [Bacteroidota bacterium]